MTFYLDLGRNGFSLSLFYIYWVQVWSADLAHSHLLPLS